jgi:lipopolysaccharide transport system permease protein
MRHDLATAWRLRRLLGVMVWREVASRHTGTVGGWFWVYAQPLLTVAAYYLVFDVVFAMRLAPGAPTKSVGIFLIVGMLPWQAFCEAIARTTNSLVDAGHLLQKNALPPVLLVLRSTLAAAVVHLPLILLLVLLYWPLNHGAWALLALPLVVALQYVLAYLLGHALAILAAALRDTIQLVGFLLTVGVFFSPVLFPASMFPAKWVWVLWLNPMTAWVLAYQSMLLQGQWPSVDMWVGMLAWLAVGLLVLVPLVQRSRDELVDWL